MNRNQNRKALVRSLIAWFFQNARDLPWRRTRDPYAIWVSEVMLQQTQVNTVLPYWRRWMQAFPSIPSLARAPSERVLKLWEGLGYYSRARNLHRAAAIIVDKHGACFPREFDKVLALPGIGRYTAGAICSIAFDQSRPVLDGNVVRVLTRLFGIGENPRSRETNERLWSLAEELVRIASKTTPPACAAFNQSLMELGALICTPRRPKCPQCPIRRYCVAYRDDRTEQLPNLGPRTATISRRFVAFVAEHRGRFLVRQRPSGVVNAHLWEFPNVELAGQRIELKEIARHLLQSTPGALELMAIVKHSITRFRITLEVFRVKVDRPLPRAPRERLRIPTSRSRRGNDAELAAGLRMRLRTPAAATPGERVGPKQNRAPGQWLTRKQLEPLAFARAHRKILDALPNASYEPDRGRPRPQRVPDASCPRL